ncbi:MAG: hypothetical protein GWO24_37535 [Akkermansiaceae bacterium]|nr:hypothetical protein [Akkermansiaceae bacterium]
MSDRPHGEMYALSCVTAATAVADLARIAPIGPLHVGALGTCTYGWSDDLNKWVRLDSNCSSGKICPDSSDVQSDLSGYAHSGQYLLPCVSAPIVSNPSSGGGGQ